MSNFTLTFFAIGLVVAAISLARRPRPLSTSVVVESVFAWFVLFAIGVTSFYNFVMHVFFVEMSARFIGWADSPFQFEVGTASLGFAVVGFLAFRGNFGLRTAAVVGPACFLLGAAAGHVYQMTAAHNFAPGNSGIILYTDIGIPVVGFVLLWLQNRFPVRGTSG